MLCPEYPSAIKRKVTGDWNCPHCQNLNFSFRNECNKWHFTKTEFKESGFPSALYLFISDGDPNEGLAASPKHRRIVDLPSVSPLFGEKYFKAPTEVRPITGRMLDFDYSKGRAQPKIISSDISLISDRKQVNVIMADVKKPYTERNGDWICLECKNLNFAFRDECNRCHTPKDSYIEI